MKPFQYDLLPSPNHIRYATFPRAAENGSLHFELKTVDLDQANNYYALSYVWRDPLKDHSVFITNANQGWVPVTNSLFQILNGLRDCDDLDANLLIWMDCVCINQADPKERAQQVVLMSKVYARAKSVITCLGPASADLNLALTHMECLWAYHKEHKDELVPDPRLSDNRRFAHLGLPPVTDLGWSSLKALLDQPWSQRLWLIQESLVNPSMLLLCGSRLIDWNRLVKVGHLTARGYLPWWTALTFDANRDLNQKGAGFLSKLQNLRDIVKEHGASPLPLATWLSISRYHTCSDPRDRAFALLGLTSDRDQLRITPDYEKSVEEVYRECAARMLTKDPMLRTLNDVSTRKKLYLPSWVPDWSVNPYQETLSQTFFKAGGPRLALPSFSQDKARVAVDGFKFEEIEEVWSPHTHDFSKLDKRSFATFVDILWTAKKRYPRRYSRPKSAFTALWKTMVADTVEMERATDEFVTHVLSYIRTVSHFQFQKEPIPKGAFGSLPVIQAREFGVVAQRYGHGRRICVTRSGHLCLAPEETRVGDIVTFLAGARTPFIIRPISGPSLPPSAYQQKESENDGEDEDRVKNEYSIIGQIYIHGAMDGEITTRNNTIFRKIAFV